MHPNHITKPLDVNALNLPLQTKKLLNAGDGWEIILAGEEIRRSKNLKRVAITHAEFTFNSEENLQKFINIIKKSYERLSKVPDEEVLYDWRMLKRKGLTIKFGLTCFNEEFYQKKKKAYNSLGPQEVLSTFGATTHMSKVEFHSP